MEQAGSRAGGLEELIESASDIAVPELDLLDRALFDRSIVPAGSVRR